MTHTHRSPPRLNEKAAGATTPTAVRSRQAMTAPEPNDDRPNKLPGTPNGGTVLTVSGDDTDSTMAEYPTRSASSITELWLPDTDDANLDVYAYDYDDEPGAVELCVSLTGAHVTLNLTPEYARALAGDLDDAARRVNDGE